MNLQRSIADTGKTYSTGYDGGKMSIRTTLPIMAVALLSAGVAGANPLPGPSSENQFTIMQTFEFTFHIEGSVEPDTMGTWILYGGPTLAYVWSPETIKGSGAGVELGAELRRYFKQPLSGPFAGVYMGAGVLWRSGEEHVEAISAGFKLGWRIPFLSRGLLLDLEPYICVGVKLLSNDGDDNGGFFDSTLYLGTKFDFY